VKRTITRLCLLAVLVTVAFTAAPQARAYSAYAYVAASWEECYYDYIEHGHWELVYWDESEWWEWVVDWYEPYLLWCDYYNFMVAGVSGGTPGCTYDLSVSMSYGGTMNFSGTADGSGNLEFSWTDYAYPTGGSAAESCLSLPVNEVIDLVGLPDVVCANDEYTVTAIGSQEGLIPNLSFFGDATVLWQSGNSAGVKFFMSDPEVPKVERKKVKAAIPSRPPKELEAWATKCPPNVDGRGEPFSWQYDGASVVVYSATEARSGITGVMGEIASTFPQHKFVNLDTWNRTQYPNFGSWRSIAHPDVWSSSFQNLVLFAHGNFEGIIDAGLRTIYDPATSDGQQFYTAIDPSIYAEGGTWFPACYGMLDLAYCKRVANRLQTTVWVASAGAGLFSVHFMEPRLAEQRIFQENEVSRAGYWIRIPHD